MNIPAPLLPTPSQTVGPYFGLALPWADGPMVVPAGTPGGMWLRGLVTDGAGDPVPDALIETWQADQSGSLSSSRPDSGDGFRGFGRSATDADGRFAIHTVRPGPVADGAGLVTAPYIALTLFGRGFLKQAVTRVYFEGDPANEVDPFLVVLPEASRRTLVAQQAEDGFHFDIRLQGDDATAFFEL